MSNNNGDMPASPILNDWEGFTAFIDGTKGGRNYGLTKREHFAAMALTVAGEEYVKGLGVDYGPTEGWQLHVAINAVSIADALLAELEK